MIKLWGILKGLLIQESSDRSKQLSVEVDAAATTATRTTLKSAQTADRTLNLPDANDTLVGKATTDILTNKTIDGDDNTLQDIDLPSLKTQAADAGKFLLRDGLGQVASGNAVPGGTVVGDNDAQTLTNKTIDGTSATGTNTVSIDAADATYDNSTSGLTASNAQAAIDEVEGRLDTAESGKLDGPGTHSDNILLKTDGVDTNNSQVTGISVDDLNNVTGVNDLTVGGNLTVEGTTTTLNTANLDVEDTNITVNKNGNDASSEGAGLTVERTGVDGSIVYEDALTSKFKIGALGSEVEAADVSSAQTITNKNLSSNTNNIDTAKADSLTRNTGNQQVVTIPDTATPDNFVLEAQTQTLTNKDIDGGTASNTSRITLSKGNNATLNGLTRKEGTVFYNTDLDTIVYDDGTQLNEISGTGSAGINYVPNPDGEGGNTGYNAYSDASGAVPIDGTGGTALYVTPSIITLSADVIRGNQSVSISKNANNGQGEGVSIDLDQFDNADLNERIQVSFDYDCVNTNYQSGDIRVFIYDIDNTTLIGAVENDDDGDLLYSQNGTFVGQFDSTNSRNYRLIFHVATTNATDYIVGIDNVQVGPVGFIPARANNEVETKYLSSSVSSTGTLSDLTFTGLEIGKFYEVRAQFDGIDVGTNNADYRWFVDIVNGANILGRAGSRLQGGTQEIDAAYNYGSVNVVFQATSTTLQATVPGLTNAEIFGSGGADGSWMQLETRNDLGSSNVISNFKLNQETVSMSAYLGSDQGFANNIEGTIAIDTVLFDDFNMLNPSNGEITVPRDGKFFIRAKCRINDPDWDAEESVLLRIYVNGTLVSENQQEAEVTASTPVQNIEITAFEKLNAGDVITVRFLHLAGGNITVDGGARYLTNVSVISHPDFTTYGVIKGKNKIQEKILTSNNNVTDLNLSNLVIGKWYEITGNMSMSVDVGASDEFVACLASHNGTTLQEKILQVSEATNTVQETSDFGISFKFKAATTTLTWSVSSGSAASFVEGNGTKAKTWIQVEERNDLIETSEF